MEKVRQMPKGKAMRSPRHSKRKIELLYFDYSLLAVIIFLVCFGLVMLYSTSAYSAMVQYDDSMHYFKRQLFFCVAGFAGMYIVSRIDYHIYSKYAAYLYGISIFMMALVQTPLGVEVNGAKRWLKLPFQQQLQPSEITKIAVILFIPVVICKLGSQVVSLVGVLRVLAWGAVSSACVYFLTENLSTGVIVFGISCIMLFVVHPKTVPFVAAAGCGAVLFFIAARVLSSKIEAGTLDDFRLRRIIVWLAPEEHASDWGFQVTQGLYAIGSGGFFGKGLGNSAQKMVIPEVQNDMILSIICEELGVFGAMIVFVMFGLMLYRLAFIAKNAPDLYGALIVSGIFAHIALQVILNVMVVTNWIPTTGITLPFISYGGTSMLFLMVEMGIALGISRGIKIEE